VWNEIELSLPVSIASDICASFQQVAFHHIKERVLKAIHYVINTMNIPISRLIISGGVSKNLYLRNLFTEISTSHSIDIDFPPLELCTDNGVMIAWAGIEIFTTGKGKILTNKNEIEELYVHSKWPLGKPEDLIEVDSQYIHPSINQKRRGLI
jgi:N6-L-threonylcarbamoyladenine synthase